MTTRWYDGWKTRTYSCGECGRTAAGAECTRELLDSSAMELLCPGCGNPVDQVAYPTPAETSANRDRLPLEERRLLEWREQQAARCLNSPDQLPELAGEAMVLEW